MDQIQVRYGDEGKVCSIQDFMKLQNLSGITLKIQQASKKLYELNKRNPPLFHFPDFPPDKPLLIDCTTATTDECSAHYVFNKHVIEFVKTLHDNPHLDNKSFTVILAHELTHAEQDRDEINNKRLVNGLRYHQITLLMEAQAFAKGKEVDYILSGKGDYFSDSQRLKTVESEIKWLLTDRTYREIWASFLPIRNTDTMIDSIPKELHLPNNLLSSISHFPHIALRPELRDISDIRNHPGEIYDYFTTECNKEKQSKSARALLDKLIFNNQVSPETLKQDFEMIHLLINLSDRFDKPVLSQHILSALFIDKEAFQGIDESPLFKLAQTVRDNSGNKIFPDNFAQKVKNLSLSQFSYYVNHYLDTVNPVQSLDLDTPVTNKNQSKPTRIEGTLVQKPHRQTPNSSLNMAIMAQKLRKTH